MKKVFVLSILSFFVFMTSFQATAVELSARTNDSFSFLNTNTENASFYHSSLKRTFILSLPESDNPLKDQENLLASLQNRIPFTLLHQYSNAINAIAIEVSGYNTWALQSLPTHISIYSANETIALAREIELVSVNAQFGLQSTQWETEFTGKNVKVGLIDTGIDLNHGDFSYSSSDLPKIYKGYDIADDDENLQDLRIYAHGTHVGGIIAGNNPTDTSRKGIAPDASLLVYKVFTDQGGLTLEDIIKAIDMAVEQECDVINMSLGYSMEEPIPSIDKDNPMYIAIENATKAGITVCAAAGNYGARTKEHPWKVLAPFVFDHTIGVAASDDRLTRTLTITSSKKTPLTMNVQQLLHTPTFDGCIEGDLVLDCGYGSKEEINPGKPLYYAIVHRGPEKDPISLLEKVQNISARNFLGCIIVDNNNNLNSTFSILESNDVTDIPTEKLLPTVIISQKCYDVIKPYLNQDSILSISPYEQSTISDFTCTGPCGDADLGFFKPDVCAPGKQISSAALAKRKSKGQYEDRYEIWEGTSMATACTSGVVALIKEAHPQWSPHDVKCALMNTADILVNPMNNQPYSYFLQGSGQINAKFAIHTPLLITPPSHQKFIGSNTPYNQTFTITNTSNEPVQAVPSFSIHTEIKKEKQDLTRTNQRLEFISFHPSKIEVQPGETTTVQATINPSPFFFISPVVQGEFQWDISYASESAEDRPKKLHVPLILHKESITPVKEGISNGDITQVYKSLYDISFELHSGTKLQYPTAYALFNIAEQLRLFVTDQDDQLLGEIYYTESMHPGTYHVKWDMTNLNNEKFLSKGTYKVVLEINGRSYSRNPYGTIEIQDNPTTYFLDTIDIQ
ncbi:MAG: S8 family serine peptidase [Caldisericia bacterium]|nr:S8 family serine peptidase [Caldisericia bacterium]